MLRPRPRAPLVAVLVLLGGLVLAPLGSALSQGDLVGGDHVVTFRRALTAGERADFLALAPGARFYETLPGAHVDVSGPALQLLAARPYVERVDRDAAIELHLERAEALIRATRLPEETGLTGEGVTVAIVDSGLDPRHPDLQGRVKASLKYVNGQWIEAPADTQGHGTHVAGILGGSGAASGGRFRGLAPGVEIVSLDFSGSFTTSAAIAAFDWIQENRERLGIRIVTNSWGRADGATRYDPEDPVVRATDRLVDEGLLVIFSAANKGPNARTLSAEAMNPRVLAVGATDAAGVIAPFSSRGPAVDARTGRDLPWVKPDLVADGTAVWSLRSPTQATSPLQPTGGPVDLEYQALSGTSQAAPQVAGLAALMLEANPDLTPQEIIRMLKQSAIDLGQPGPDPEYGHGLVDALDAIHLARDEPEDHGNILIAGGEDITRVEGRLLSAAGRTLQMTPRPQLAEGGALRIPVAVKPGARDLRVDFVWQPEGGNLRLSLEKDGVVRGPWTQAARVGDSLLLTVAPGPLEPGDWTLVATPEAPLLTPVDFTLTTRSVLPPRPDRAVGIEETYREAPAAPPGRGGVAAATGWSAFLAEAEALAGLESLVFATVGAGGGLAAVWMLRRRHPPV
ncbi:MAG TPA: S8 family serine peptidase [Candidatus Thermoplasmatota archaeon]|nr:S8 family serine peptidase [Candidatus Thermoplasmatota archaeon]